MKYIDERKSCFAWKRLYDSKFYWPFFFILAFTVTGCISISAFAYLVGITIGITSSAIGL